MVGWIDGIVQPFSQPSMFRIEFIRHIDGRTVPEAMHTIEGLFKDLYAAIEEANITWPSIHDGRGGGAAWRKTTAPGQKTASARTIQFHPKGRFMRRVAS